jgi:exopolyphosphatase / guanosine-5'-triphosphate,3'-diphosphate pyrophosphatase
VTRVAAVDLGTNSTRLLVADVEHGELTEVERLLAITRLGEGVDGRRILSRDGIERVAACLDRYRQVTGALAAERRVAYATSAVRDATNGEAFLADMAARFGFPTRLLSGEEEALFTFAGVSAAAALLPATLVLDLGGGSTEFIIGAASGIVFQTSLDIGCVRLTERFPATGEGATCNADSVVAFVRALLEERMPASPRPVHGIGVAGTVTTLATLDLGLAEEVPELVHGHRLSSEWIAAEAERLATTPLAKLLSRRGIEPARAPVIAAGALVLAEILRFFDLPELEVSEWDVLHGVALELGSERTTQRAG